jgi:hypothetical protein
MKVVLSILVLLLLAAATAFAAEEEAPRCDFCGMFYENSAARVAAAIEFEDETYRHLRGWAA